MTTARLYVKEGVEQRRLGRRTATEATGLLPFAPPAGTYMDMHITNGMFGSVQDREILLTASINYNLIFDEVMTQRLKINGGNHVKIIGAEFNIAVQVYRAGFDIADGARYDNNNGFEFTNQTGTVFLEGIWMHGPYMLDCIRASNGSQSSSFVIQNTRLDCDCVVSGQNNADGVIHTDGFQCWGGLKSLTMYNVTVSNPYQGGMFGDGALAGLWGPTSLRRVNYRCGLTVGQATKMINFVASADFMRGPFIISDDTYYAPAPSVTWDTTFKPTVVPPYTGGAFYSGTIIGTDPSGRDYGEIVASTIAGIISTSNGEGAPARFYRGLPPGGDYVTGGGTGPGATYVSPGYAPAPAAATPIPASPYTASYMASY